VKWTAIVLRVTTKKGSVADPDPVLGYPKDPGSGMNFFRNNISIPLILLQNVVKHIGKVFKFVARAVCKKAVLWIRSRIRKDPELLPDPDP
jgi:hypothetical protein